MRICLISAEHSPWGGIGHSERRLATLLATRHEVTLVRSEAGMAGDPRLAEAGVREVVAEPSADVRGTTFANEEHRSSAAVLEAIEAAYGGHGPDYVEAADYRAQGLVPLQARQAGDRLFESTFFGVRIAGTAELVNLHDHALSGPDARLLGDLEREQLRLADRLLCRGGDIVNVYSRYYPFPLPPSVLIRAPFAAPDGPPRPQTRRADEPLRILYVGRLQRFKGALDLAEACLWLDDEEWRLTMIGADTPTAPAGQSVRLTIEAMFGGDPRLRIEEPLDHDELQGIWSDHDLLVVPSRFETWSNVCLEAMRSGLPILATPVGGPSELVDHGVTGWLVEDVGVEALRQGLSQALAQREALEGIRASGAIFDRFRRLTDPAQVLDGYDGLLPTSRRASVRDPCCDTPPLVSVIIPHYLAGPYVEEAAASALDQTHQPIEVVLVDDGAFPDGRETLARLARDARVRVVAQPHWGDAPARNLGARLARGEYVVMLDADNALEPEFCERALEAFRREPELAYVTCWLRFVTEGGSPHPDAAGYAALGNRVVAGDEGNWDGDTLAMMPRRIFTELGHGYDDRSAMQSDWELYRQLREDGLFGAVIPERLARYRVRGDSLLRAHPTLVHRRSWAEALSRRELRRTRWTVGA
jgi:glycogen synthase